jgi:hypothetical protein
MYGGYGFGIMTRLYIVWEVLTARGIIGVVYSSYYGHTDEGFESSIEKMGDYGIVHGQKTYETHNYPNCTK